MILIKQAITCQKERFLFLTAFPLRTADMPKVFSTVSAGFFHGSISSFTAIAVDCGKPVSVRFLKSVGCSPVLLF